MSLAHHTSFKKSAFHTFFLDAAERIKARGERVSLLTLSEELDWTRERLVRRLDADPNLKRKLKLQRDIVVLLVRAAKIIKAKRRAVTIGFLAKELRRKYQQVLHIVKRNAYLIDELGIVFPRPKKMQSYVRTHAFIH